jgi:endonuclease/exonuclease/phosphatase family metal-dependent hydrolase
VRASPSPMQLRVALTTWNVGGAAPSPGGVPPDARALLRALDARVDVAVVGLQEVPWPSRGWKAALLAGLGSAEPAGGGGGVAGGTGWRIRAGCRYLGMRVVVLVRNRARDRVVALRAMRVGSGVADRFPNKGAVAVELALDKTTTACFVVAHLAAQEGNVREREEDWVNIVRRLQNANTVAADGINVPLFMRYDHVFVMGDLNYRLVPRVGSTLAQRVAWVEDRVRAADWPALAAVDELAVERATGNVFVNFNEGPLNFPPTFKYETATPAPAKYNAARVPSYCDRVLWHSLPARSALVQLDSYTTLDDITASDHRPVRAVLDILTPPAPQRVAIHSTGGLRIVLEFSFVRLVRFKKDPKRKKRRRRKQSLSDSDARRHIVVETCAASTPAASSTMHVEGLAYGAVTVFPGTMNLDSGERYGVDGTSEVVDDDDFSSSSSSSGSSSDMEAGGSGDSDDAEICSDCDDDESSPPSSSEGRLAGATADKDALLESQTTSTECAGHLTSTRDSRNKNEPAFASEKGGVEAIRQDTTAGTSSNVFTRRQFNSDQLRRRDVSSSEGDDMPDLLSRELRALDLCSDGSVPRPDVLRRVVKQAVGPQLLTGAVPPELAALRRSGHSRSHSGPVLSRSPKSGKHAIRESTYNPVRREFLVSAPSAHRQEAPIAGNSRKSQKARNPAKTWLMDIHGSSVFLDSTRVYQAEIPKRKNGSRECGSECLPAIPFTPVRSIQDLRFEHLQISFWRAKSRLGLSGVLPLSMLLEDPLEPYSFELKLTKYGREAGLLEACVRLVVSDSRLWVDSQGHVVRTASGLSSKLYMGPLAVREKVRKVARFSSRAAKTAQSARAVTKIIARKLDSLGSDKG